MSKVPRVLVAAGLIVDGGRVLLTQRRAGGPMGLMWELPGGKLEPGEAPELALSRELLEEIGCEVEVGRIWDVLYHRYPGFELLMLVYYTRLREGQVPSCREVESLAWAQPAELGDYDVLPADEPLLHRLKVEGVPEFVACLPADGQSL